jgi:hypothetical protein
MARKLPELKETSSDKAGVEWLVLGWVISPDRGFTVNLSVVRWVRLEGSSKLFMATVWNEGSGLVLGTVEVQRLTDEIDKLVTLLAADHLIANPPRGR